MRPSGGFTTWLRRHSKILTFIGAALVLSTFITKDILREQQKDLRDSLESTNSFFALREQIRDVSYRVNFIENTIIPQTSHTSGNDLSLPAVNDFADKINFAFQRSGDLRTGLENIRVLSERLSGASVKILRAKLEGENALVDHVEGNLTLLDVALDRTKKDPEQFKQLIGEYMNDLSDLEDGIAFCEKEFYTSRTEIIALARRQNDHADRKYNRFTVLSYGFYILGILVGLSGELLGVEGTRVQE